MKILIDMNLSPDWVEMLSSEGIQAVHWSQIGDPGAKDVEIMAWAKEHEFIVFTHDLDFGALLAATQAQGPSVLQVRTQDVMPRRLIARVAQVLQEFTLQLEQGALLTVDERKARVRLLPFFKE